MNTVGYVRLSRDEDKENYSSIESQKDMIYDYAKSRGWTVSKIYADDNYSGYTFNRPAYKEMIEEVEKKNIDTIIVKDLSRIGRKNSKVLTIIDDFKETNIRLILITEGSNGALDILEDDLDILGIKTWYNEMYVKDISKKIRSSMHAKQKKGELIMGNFYGYNKKKMGDKFYLFVDEEIRPIIELIYKLYIEGLGYKKICDVLNEKGYLTPSQYIKQRHENNGKVFKNTTTSIWQTHMIQRIISNDLYIGNLRTRKRHARLIKGKQKVVPKEDQYVFKNNHEAIISKEDFQLAQEIKSKRNKRPYRNNKAKYNYIFGSFIECGDCGHAVVGLNLRKVSSVLRGYNCSMYNKYGNKHCWNHSVKEKELLDDFREFLKDLRDEYESYISDIQVEEKKNNEKASLDRLKKEHATANDELKLMYIERIKALNKENDDEMKSIIEENYDEIEKNFKKKIRGLKEQIIEIEKITNVDIEKNLKTNIEIFNNIINAEVPKRKDLELLIDKIIISADKSSKKRYYEFKLKVNIDKLVYTNIS